MGHRQRYKMNSRLAVAGEESLLVLTHHRHESQTDNVGENSRKSNQQESQTEKCN